MAARAMLAYAGLLIAGIVILAVGAVIEPSRDKVCPLPRGSPCGAGLITEKDTATQTGESLIAVGLTLIAVGVGFFLSGTAPAMSSGRLEE